MSRFAIVYKWNKDLGFGGKWKIVSGEMSGEDSFKRER